MLTSYGNFVYEKFWSKSICDNYSHICCSPLISKPGNIWFSIVALVGESQCPWLYTQGILKSNWHSYLTCTLLVGMPHHIHKVIISHQRAPRFWHQVTSDQVSLIQVTSDMMWPLSQCPTPLVKPSKDYPVVLVFNYTIRYCFELLLLNIVIFLFTNIPCGISHTVIQICKSWGMLGNLVREYMLWWLCKLNTHASYHGLHFG